MEKFRIGVGGFSHESNTFNPIITTESDFFIIKGNDFLTNKGDSYLSARGITETLLSYGYDVCPTIFARAVPNGVVSKEFYLSTKKEMIDMLLSAKPLDAIVLALHGSMYVEDIGDAEGTLLEEIRSHFKDIPIFVSLDMHTTWTKKMNDNATGFVGYKTAPHIDTYETGAHAAIMAKHVLEGAKKLTMSAFKIPILIAGEKSETTVEPMLSMIKKLRECETDDKVIAASYLMGFPWADNKDVGVTALVVTDSDKDLADKLSKDLASYFWSKRNDFKFHVDTYPNDEAIDKLLMSKEYPSFLSDSGDNPTAGATGDSTNLLESLLKRTELDDANYRVLYSGFFDDESLKKAKEAGIGNNVSINLGGHYDKINGKSISLDVKVLNYVESYGTYNSSLALVSYKNIDIVLTSKHIGFGDDALLMALGVNPSERTHVIVKLGYLEDCFKKISKYSIMAASFGCSNEILESIEYKNVPRPLYPLDKDMVLDI